MLDRERWSRTVGRRAGVIQNCKRLDRGATGTSVSPYALLIGGTETPKATHRHPGDRQPARGGYCNCEGRFAAYIPLYIPTPCQRIVTNGGDRSEVRQISPRSFFPPSDSSDGSQSPHEEGIRDATAADPGSGHRRRLPCARSEIWAGHLRVLGRQRWRWCRRRRWRRRWRRR